jgi:ABC-2 type transport system ATP-binding protein
MSTEKGWVLHARGIRKSFDDNEVVSDVGLDVRPGEIVGFIGPNGAGKSTTLRCLLGLNFADAGEVQIAGIDAMASPVRARAQVGYLPGETSLYRQMRGHEALELGLAFHKRLDQGIIDQCLAAWGLPLERKIHAYSAGMKQQLGLAIALGPEVPLHILDEPDKALDPTHRRQLRSILLELKRRGRGLLLSSHHLSELEELADRTVFLRQGVLIPEQEIEQARADISLRARAPLRHGSGSGGARGHGLRARRSPMELHATPCAGPGCARARSASAGRQQRQDR